MGSILAVSVGIYSVAWWPSLPSLALYFLACLTVSLVAILCRQFSSRHSVYRSTDALRWFVMALWGGCWGLISAHQLLGEQLPGSMDREGFIVTGHIIGLVDSDHQRSRFRFVVEHVQSLDQNREAPKLRLLLLSWYQWEPHRLSPGDSWRLLVRLRRPRGLVNSGAFDYQSWLTQQGISATGYVVTSEHNQVVSQTHHAVWRPLGKRVDIWRTQLREQILEAPLSETGRAIILALSIGDKTHIADQWSRLAQLGIVHLLVISGLHIGLVAGFGFILGLGLSRLFATLLLRSNANLSPIGRWLPPIFALLSAAIYSQLAGFSLATQRALIGVVLLMLAKLLYRRVSPLGCVIWALLLIAISQPLAALNAGFWLSFTAVLTLIFWFFPWHSRRDLGTVRRTAGAQIALMLALLAPSLFVIGRASWLAPIVNLAAVPWVSLVTVPLSLVASLLARHCPEVAIWLWQLADYSILALWFLFDLIPRELGFLESPVPLSPWLFSAVFIAVCGLLVPSGLKVRLASCLPLIALLAAPESEPPLRVTVLDVGQGLSVVIESPDQVLVYDTGPRWNERLGAGDAIVGPYLRARGRQRIDRLVLSHRDNDHAGGLAGLLREVEVGRILPGPSLDTLNQTDSAGYSAIRLILDTKNNPATDNIQQLPLDPLCSSGQRWFWPEIPKDYKDTIEFNVLAPKSNLKISSGQPANNSSCVLLIRWRDQLILLPGDIQKSQEMALLAEQLLPQVALLIAPHHGSKTSSTESFVQQLRPAHVVFSAGYKHHFGHPHSDVVGRYQAVGSSLWYTANQGGVSFIWDTNGALSVETARQLRGAYWWR